MKFNRGKYPKNEKKQKLRKCVRNNVIVNTVLRQHKGKINTKFFIRTINALCEHKKFLMNFITNKEIYEIKPIEIIFKGEVEQFIKKIEGVK